MPEGHPESARPKVVTIRYKCKSSEAAEVASSMALADVHSSQQRASIEVKDKPAKEQEKEETDIEIL